MLLTNTPLVHQGFHGEPCEHLSVTEVELCNDYLDAEYDAMMQAERDADLGYERYLENQGYWAAREQEHYEAQRGVVQFDEAMFLATGRWPGEDYEEQQAINAQNAAEGLAYDRHREALAERALDDYMAGCPDA